MTPTTSSSLLPSLLHRPVTDALRPPTTEAPTPYFTQSSSLVLGSLSPRLSTSVSTSPPIRPPSDHLGAGRPTPNQPSSGRVLTEKLALSHFAQDRPASDRRIRDRPSGATQVVDGLSGDHPGLAPSTGSCNSHPSPGMNQTLHVRLDSEPISKLPSIELRQRRIGEPIVLQEDELVDGASTSPAGPCPAAKRRKVCQACTNCQKGHMSCDESRPCQRCIKRGLAATCQNPQKKPTTKACLSCPVLIRPAPPKPESSFVFPSLSSTKPASRSLSRELLSLPPSRANSKSPSGSPALSSPSQLQPQPQIKIPTVSIQRPIEVSRIASPLPSSSALAHGFDQAPSVLTDSVLLSSLMSLAAAATAQDLPEAVATSTPSSPMSGSLVGRLLNDPACASPLGSVVHSSAIPSPHPYSPSHPPAQQDGLFCALRSSLDSISTQMAPSIEYDSNAIQRQIDHLAHLAHQIAAFQNATTPRAHPPPTTLAVPSMASPPDGQQNPLATAESGLSASGLSSQTTLNMLGSLIDYTRAQPDAEPLSVLPHDYQSGYNRARSYMATHISVAGQDKINKVILTSQAVFSLLVKSPPISELIQVERRFRDLVRNYWQQQQQQQHQQQHQSRESAKIATAVWRRTGEIYGASHLFLQLLHLTPDQVVEGRTGIYEFMTEDSLVSYWERYGQLSFGKSNEVRVGPCILRNRNLPGAELHYSNLSIEFHHDHWGVPLMIIGTFLILDLDGQHSQQPCSEVSSDARPHSTPTSVYFQGYSIYDESSTPTRPAIYQATSSSSTSEHLQSITTASSLTQLEIEPAKQSSASTLSAPIGQPDLGFSPITMAIAPALRSAGGSLDDSTPSTLVHPSTSSLFPTSAFLTDPRPIEQILGIPTVNTLMAAPQETRSHFDFGFGSLSGIPNTGRYSVLPGLSSAAKLPIPTGAGAIAAFPGLARSLHDHASNVPHSVGHGQISGQISSTDRAPQPSTAQLDSASTSAVAAPSSVPPNSSSPGPLQPQAESAAPEDAIDFDQLEYIALDADMQNLMSGLLDFS